MQSGMSYEAAHKLANDFERQYREMEF